MFWKVLLGNNDDGAVFCGPYGGNVDHTRTDHGDYEAARCGLKPAK
jgi:hypothetical protein